MAEPILKRTIEALINDLSKDPSQVHKIAFKYASLLRNRGKAGEEYPKELITEIDEFTGQVESIGNQYDPDKDDDISEEFVIENPFSSKIDEFLDDLNEKNFKSLRWPAESKGLSRSKVIDLKYIVDIKEHGTDLALLPELLDIIYTYFQNDFLINNQTSYSEANLEKNLNIYRNYEKLFNESQRRRIQEITRISTKILIEMNTYRDPGGKDLDNYQNSWQFQFLISFKIQGGSYDGHNKRNRNIDESFNLRQFENLWIGKMPGYEEKEALEKLKSAYNQSYDRNFT